MLHPWHKVGNGERWLQMARLPGWTMYSLVVQWGRRGSAVCVAGTELGRTAEMWPYTVIKASRYSAGWHILHRSSFNGNTTINQCLKIGTIRKWEDILQVTTKSLHSVIVCTHHTHGVVPYKAKSNEMETERNSRIMTLWLNDGFCQMYRTVQFYSWATHQMKQEINGRTYATCDNTTCLLFYVTRKDDENISFIWYPL